MGNISSRCCTRALFWTFSLCRQISWPTATITHAKFIQHLSISKSLPAAVTVSTSSSLHRHSFNRLLIGSSFTVGMWRCHSFTARLYSIQLGWVDRFRRGIVFPNCSLIVARCWQSHNIIKHIAKLPLSFLIAALEELFSIAQSSFWPSEAGEGIRRGRNYRVVVWTRGPLVFLGSIFLPAGFPAGFEKSRCGIQIWSSPGGFEIKKKASSDQQRQRSDLVS